MITPSSRIAALSCALVAASMIASSPAYAGPPWISAEYPANPHESVTRGAFFLVHTYHHGAPMASTLTGTAEGMVNGRRQSVKLEFVPTGKPGIYAVRYQPAQSGVWVLAINMGDEDNDAAGMLVRLGTHGEISSINVPSRETEGGRWIVPRQVTAQDVTEALRSQTALLGARQDDNGSGGVPGTMLVAAGLGLVLGVPLVRGMRSA